MPCSVRHLTKCRTVVPTVILAQQRQQRCISVCPNRHLLILRYLKRMSDRRRSIEVRMKKNEMPVGLGMALAMNPEAMEKFASLSEAKKQEIIDGTHNVSSKAEMRQYVENIKSVY